MNASDTVATYRGLAVTTADVAEIRDLIAKNPDASRRALSLKLCEAWDWTQPNGTPRDNVCRGLLLKLHRAGEIELPPPRWRSSKPRARHRPRPVVEVARSPLVGPLSRVVPLRFLQVRRTEHEPLLESLIETHHYLGYSQPVGEHLKFLVFSGERPIACFIWSSSAHSLAPRDRYIGWTVEQRRRHLQFIVYNSRFLILPWISVPSLASHLLARMTKILSAQWQQAYGHPVYFAETFVDPTRYRGTCYRAANWVYLGRTTGRGKEGSVGPSKRPIKEVLGYPLHSRFRTLLTTKDVNG